MGSPVVNHGPGEHRPCVRYLPAVVRLITLHFNVCKDELKLVCCAMGKKRGFLWCIFQWKAKSSELLQCVCHWAARRQAVFFDERVEC